MAAAGYVTHAEQNRQMLLWLVAGYVVAFQVICAFALTILLLIVDEEHTIFSDPFGYIVRYGLPVAALTGLVFWRLYRGHAHTVERNLNVRQVTRETEPRFVRIAEEQCTSLGVRRPRFGIVEATAPNALTVGEGPNDGLIAVTRGLLDTLDDDELAAVLAHEASHIRNGDTRILAANHAMMRTATILQVNNPLRIEDWRQLFLVVMLPAMLLILLASGAATMASLALARASRRGIQLTRDHIADGEAIRVTHFPEALISALRKVAGQCNFPGVGPYEALLFHSNSDRMGAARPAVAARIAAISTLGQQLMQPARVRKDTRAPRLSSTRCAAVPQAPLFGQEAAKPLTSHWEALSLLFTNRTLLHQREAATNDKYAWTEGDGRNVFGVAPHLVIPLAAAITGLLVFHWPDDGNFSKMARIFNPMAMVDVMRTINNGPICTGPKYPNGKCKFGEDA